MSDEAYAVLCDDCGRLVVMASHKVIVAGDPECRGHIRTVSRDVARSRAQVSPATDTEE